MKYTLIISVMVMLATTICFSQNQEMNSELEYAKQLGKDSIVQLALEFIDKEIDVKNYKIKVMASRSSIFVSFYMPIKYVPYKSIYYFDVGVNLTDKMIFKSPVSNPIDYKKKNIPFYTPTEKAKKIIEFVVDILNKNNELGLINIQSFDDNMIIREKPKFYDITIVSKYMEASYKIDKKSAKVFYADHAHLELPPEDDDDEIYEEIK